MKQTSGYFIHRALSTYLNTVIEAGCTLQRISKSPLEQTIAELHCAVRSGLVPGSLVIFATKFSSKEARSGEAGLAQIACSTRVRRRGKPALP